MTGLDPDLRALQEVRDCMERAARAQKQIACYDQARIDAVCLAVSQAAAGAAWDLARSAVDETGIGRAHYKVLKNIFAAEGTWESIQDERTVGIVNRDDRRGTLEVATPAGVIAAIIPTTNPTSTTINNALISLKGKNAIVISPHPRARRCIGETVEVMRAALERAGAPGDLVQALSNPTIESTGALMRHKRTAIILATGGSGLVHAAYSSGKPAYGVGPGNVPAYIDRTADVKSAAQWIVASQSFDNATLCCSEQALVLDKPIAEAMLSELRSRGAHLCDDAERRQLEAYCNRGGHMNADVVGQDPSRIAEAAGFHVPCSTTLLLAFQDGVGRDHPLSIEVLAPVLSVHVVDGWEAGCEVSLATLRNGGMGHTIGLWATDEVVLNAWFIEKPASRIVVNGPTSQGATGYSTNLTPAFSLGCGPQAGNITSDNITARHLINTKRVGFVTSDWNERYVRDHGRAAKLSGESAPRGSGLPGDPGLSGSASGPKPAPQPGGGWTGNPPVHVAPAPQAPRLPSAGSAPRFTAPTSSHARPRPQRPAPAPLPAPAGSSAAGPYVGLALTPAEIQGILAQAGGGCPLGPCSGCGHHDHKSGACHA